MKLLSDEHTYDTSKAKLIEVCDYPLPKCTYVFARRELYQTETGEYFAVCYEVGRPTVLPLSSQIRGNNFMEVCIALEQMGKTPKLNEFSYDCDLKYFCLPRLD